MEVASPVFIESVTGASVFLGDVEGFAKTEIVLKGQFRFARHGFEDGWFFPVDGEVAGLFVGRDARVAPLAFFHSFAVLSAACDNFSHSLADVFLSTGACEHVYAFLLVWVFFSLAVRAEDTSQFAAAPESDVEACLFCSAFERIRDGGYVGKADEGFFFQLGQSPRW